MYKKMNSDLKNLSIWYKRHGLVVNPSKSVSMLMGHGRLLANVKSENVRNVEINNVKLLYQEKIKCLGIWITSSLSWTHQVNVIVGKFYNYLYAFRKLLRNKSLGIKKQLIQGLVIPHLLHSLPVMSDLNFEQRLKLQRVLNESVRFILNLHQPLSSH